MIKISLIVPTYNRADYLKFSLPTFVRQSLDKPLYEILVIDNNSTDKTKEITFEILCNTNRNWKYIFEGKQGLHYARNRGILEAKGDIVIFGDDDIEASPFWLESIYSEFKNNERAGVVGGKILPKWNSEPPEWIYDYGTRKIHNVFAYLDLGEERKIMNNCSIMGCNFAIRKDIAIRIGGSPPDTFPGRLKHLSGRGETEMIQRTMKLNYDIVYIPEALVFHHAASSRATLKYFVDRYERWAVENAFAVYRKNRYKLIASIILMISALKTLFSVIRVELNKALLKRSKLDKINPIYFRIIRIKSSLMTIRQVFRVLSSDSLYSYIKKENYLVD